MKTFEQIREELTLAQRMAKARALRRNKAKLKRGRDIASRKTATSDVLMKRAMKDAKAILIKKWLKGKSKSEATPAEKSRVEKKLKANPKMIERIARKLLPKVRAQDRA